MATVLIGCARVSTADQDPAHQVDALLRAGVAPGDVHLDHASGAKASRPQLDLVLTLLRAEDTLVITRLDRLGRPVLHLITLSAQLRERGVGLRVTEQGTATTSAEGRAVFGMLSVLQATLAQQLYDARTHTVQAIADLLSVPRTTVYGHLTTSPGATAAAAGA